MPNAQPNWPDIDTVLLDMDGTVLDLAFDNWFWQSLIPERYAALRGIDAEAARRELEPQFRHWEGKLEWYCLDHWTGLTGLDLRRLKREARQSIRVLPTSEAFLGWASGAGKQLWLVTNAHRATLDIKLEVTGIGRHFQRLVSSHDYGHPKESPVFWDRFEADTGLDAARSVFIDDSLPVLRAAAARQLAGVIAIRHPDSSAPRRTIEEFPAVDTLSDLIPEASRVGN